MGGNGDPHRRSVLACVDREHLALRAHPLDAALLSSAPLFGPRQPVRLDMTTHPQSEQNEAGVSRRGLVQGLAVGAAAASIATPTSAQQTSTQQASAQQQASVLAEATSADYARDPTRWGSAEVAALFPGFKHIDMRTKGAIIRLRHGGSGPPLLLLHGNPN